MPDYFELFGISRSVSIDLNLLRKNFYTLSRSLHPDINRNYDLAKMDVLNHAYEILSDPLQRLKYIIELEGLNDNIEKPLDPDFLLEMMELHEEIEKHKESNNPDNLSILIEKLGEFERELHSEFKDCIDNYNRGLRNDKTLQSLVDYFVRQRYLRRLNKVLKSEEEL